MNKLNLKKNLCPRCEDAVDLEWDNESKLIFCPKCKFNLRDEDFIEVMDSIREEDYHENTYDENLSMLNNL